MAYVIRAIWEGNLLEEWTAKYEEAAHLMFNDMVNIQSNNPGVTVQLIDDQDNVLAENHNEED